MLTTILRNLLMNSAKFSNSNSKISLKAAVYNAEYVIFSVKDIGIGMSKEEVKSLFDLDKSTSNTGTEGEKGTGIGLILCKDFVDYHKGNIWAESEPDKGTIFYFTIPRAK
ncbi:MAG TPA: ATP-binding protein [Bacteroidales bacterium]|nr:ATP-binding protein [Bacteroidales bacterium]